MSDARAAGPFATRAAVLAWLTEHRLEHLEWLCAGAVHPKLDRYRLIDLCSAEGLKRQKYAELELKRLDLPARACTFLVDETHARHDADDELEDRLAAPRFGPAFPLFRKLVTLRASYGGKFPIRPRAQLPFESLEVDAELPGFIFVDPRKWEVPGHFGFVEPRVRVSIDATEAHAICSCNQSRCHHSLAAIDAVLEWLHQDESDDFAAAVHELTAEPWNKALDALTAVFATQTPVEELTWRVKVDDDFELEVSPWLRKQLKSGSFSAGTRADPKRLAQQLGRPLDAADTAIAQLCETNRGAALLDALIGHPRVVLATNPNRSVTVSRAHVGLVAEDRNGEVVLNLGIDGTPLPALLLARVKSENHERPLFLFDPGPCRLEQLYVSREVREAYGVLTRFGNVFPPQAQAPLLEQLTKVATRVPVAMPRSVMGEAVMPSQRFVLRLEKQLAGAVRCELRVRPMPESEAYLPGLGPRDVHVRRGVKPLHAVRNFVEETASAKRLEERLPALRFAEHLEPFVYQLASPAEALEVISACATMEPMPAFEWSGEPVLVLGQGGPPQLKVKVEKKREWFGIFGELSVFGERVELAVALDAARRKQRFVRVTEQSYLELSQTLREQLELLAHQVQPSKKGELTIGPGSVTALSALLEAGAELNVDDEYRALTERIAAAAELTVAVPTTLKAELRDYQKDGFTWLARLAAWGAGGVLADDMGLGKTVQALALLLQRASLGPQLVVAPTSVGFNWVDEAKRFAPSLEVTWWSSLDDRRKVLPTLGKNSVLVASYGVATREVEALSEVPFATLVLDEAQALKNATTQRARAMRKLKADFVVALSGTPLENHLGELWSLYRIVLPSLFGGWDVFRDQFAIPIEKHIDPAVAPRLSAMLKPFLLRRTKTQVATELPPRTEVKVPVVLSPEEWTLYEDARLAVLSDLELPTKVLKEQERKLQVLASLTRLRLLASHSRLYDPASQVQSAKLRRLVELIDTLTQEGHRALVFSQFTAHLALVREVLDARGIRYQYLDGATPEAERQKRVRAFQEGSDPLFLISLKAGGVGLNLTAADNVIHLDPWWNPAVEDQASDRAHRIGQTRPVTVYRLVAVGTIEEKMLGLHQSKRALIAGVVEGKDVAAKLTAAELEALLRPAS